MRKALLWAVILSGLMSLIVTGTVLANSAVDGEEPAIMASPNVVVLAKVSTVTIHSNIPAAQVDPASVRLNGVEPSSLGVDNCGHIVGKFAIAELALQPGKATLTFTGLYLDGEAFEAADVVTVK